MARTALWLMAVAVAVVAVHHVDAFPRYIAVPIEDYEYLTRHRRAAAEPPQAIFMAPRRRMQQARPINEEPELVDDEPADDRYVRQAGNKHAYGKVVDYGAYTGNKGAFGWYTDHPVGKYH